MFLCADRIQTFLNGGELETPPNDIRTALPAKDGERLHRFLQSLLNTCFVFYFMNLNLTEENHCKCTGKGELILDDVTVRWEKAAEQPSLSRLNVRASEGQLVAIVGSVGSGKSSCLAAMLGEMVLSQQATSVH